MLIICFLRYTLFLLLLFLVGWSDAYILKIPNRYVAGLILWWLINGLIIMAADTLRAGNIIKAEGVLGAGGILRILSAAAIAVLVLFASSLFRFLTRRKGIGAGDIKLFFAITLYIGFEKGLTLILVSCIFAVINLLCKTVTRYRLQTVSKLRPYAISKLLFLAEQSAGTFLSSARVPSRFPFSPSIVCATVLIMLEAQLEKTCI